MDGIAQYSRELYTQMKDFIDIKIIETSLKPQIKAMNTMSKDAGGGMTYFTHLKFSTVF